MGIEKRCCQIPLMNIDIRLQPKQKEAFLKSQITPVLFYGGA